VTRPAGDVLGQRALNRALLERQLLLRRRAMPAAEALEHLVGLQAQAPLAPYVGLWTRLDGFRHDELARLISDRSALRTSLLHGTVHLVTADDCLALRPLVQPVLERGLKGAFGRYLAEVDIDAVLAMGRALLEERPRTRRELVPLLAEQWPGWDASALAYAISYLVPLVQVPPRGIWGSNGPAALAPTEAWLGRPLGSGGSADEMVMRYLAAFGPATVKDMQTWSGLTRLREVTERLRPRLRTFRDEYGRELLDLPDAARPDPDTPASPRFLPEYDNVLFAHAERARIIADHRRPPLFPGNGGVLGTVLVDGFLRGRWKTIRQRGGATLLIEPFARLSKQNRTSLAEEGTLLLAFTAADANTHDVRFASPE
jgi:hypothetical protein